MPIKIVRKSRASWLKASVAKPISPCSRDRDLRVAAGIHDDVGSGSCRMCFADPEVVKGRFALRRDTQFIELGLASLIFFASLDFLF
jgi:hypothetical protein